MGPGMYNQMARRPQRMWKDMSAQEKGQVFTNLAKVYQMVEYPEDLQNPIATNAYVMQLGNGQKRKVNKLDISGIFPMN